MLKKSPIMLCSNAQDYLDYASKGSSFMLQLCSLIMVFKNVGGHSYHVIKCSCAQPLVS